MASLNDCGTSRGSLVLGIETQTPSRNPLAIPPFLAGTGVAYNEAERVTGARGVGPST